MGFQNPSPNVQKVPDAALTTTPFFVMDPFASKACQVEMRIAPCCQIVELERC